ncbi:MAG: hypothetical protein ACK4K0_03755 [Flavobacteriales bacterium]
MKHNIYTSQHFTLLFVMFCVFIFSSCKKKEIGPQLPHENPIEALQTVIIGNEGNYGWGNASLTLYNPIEHTTSQHNQISGVTIGDVVQSVLIEEDDIFVVVNNSGKVDRLGKNFIHKAQIPGMNSPRYMAIYNQKGFVTELYSNVIYVINLATNTISGQISVSGHTEDIISLGNKLYVAQPNKHQLLVINPLTKEVEDSVAVQNAPSSIVVDKNNKIWVKCSNALVRINPVNLQIEFTLTFPQGSNLFRLAISPSKEDLYYFLNGDLYKQPISATIAPSVFFVSAQGKNFYGLGVNPYSGDVYVADAQDYVQQGVVYRYDSLGNYQFQFQAGIIPQAFGFIQK